MRLGEAPRPTPHDEDVSVSVYEKETVDAPDVHQLAADARNKRAELSEKQRLWNEAVLVSKKQTQHSKEACHM